MAATTPCTPCCPGTPQVVNVPGIQGLSYVAGSPVSAYGSGVAFSLTTISQLLNIGTAPPSITLPNTLRYAIFGRVRLDWVGATIAVGKIVTVKLRRINNTAADLGLTLGFTLPAATGLSTTAVVMNLPPWIYTPAQAGDNIELWGAIDTTPSPGDIKAVDTALVAIPIG